MKLRFLLVTLFAASFWVLPAHAQGTFPQTTTVNSTQTLNSTSQRNRVILATSGAGGITLTLPTAAGVNSGHIYFIKKVDAGAGAVTINTTSSQTIDGSLTKLLTGRYDFVWITSDGSNWHTIGDGPGIISLGTTLPTVCKVGDLFYDTDAAVGLNLYGCTTTNNWTLLGDGGTTMSGTANEITESGGVLSIADDFRISGKTNTQPVKAGTIAQQPASCTAAISLYLATNGTQYQQLKLCGADGLSWDIVGKPDNHNWLSAIHSDTVAASGVLGDILYANSTPAWTKLAGNTTATKNFLTQTGNGSVSAAPAWGTIASGDLPSHNAATATALAANGANCSAGNYPLGVDASGAVESCTAAGAGGGGLLLGATTPLRETAYIHGGGTTAASGLGDTFSISATGSSSAPSAGHPAEHVFTTSGTAGNDSGIYGNKVYLPLNRVGYFRTRVHLTFVDDQRVFVGMTSLTISDMLNGDDPAADFAGFKMCENTDGAICDVDDLSWRCVQNDAGAVETNVDSAVDAVANTDVTLEVLFDPAGITYKINGNSVCSSPVATDIPTDVAMRIVAGIQINFTETAKALAVGYLYEKEEID